MFARGVGGKHGHGVVTGGGARRGGWRVTCGRACRGHRIGVRARGPMDHGKGRLTRKAVEALVRGRVSFAETRCGHSSF